MMMDAVSLSVSLVLLASLLKDIHASDPVLSVHGSGTGNPTGCFGSIMEEMQSRSKLPIRLTYRSVGSSIGLADFINDFDMTKSAMDFGSSEIPVSTQDWQRFRDANVTLLQLPTLFGAVSFFHSIPDTPNLNLTSCLLARIFTRDIKDWAHPDILEINRGLSDMFDAKTTEDSLGSSMRIRVARREDGGSNTNAITQYLYKACPQHFPESMVDPLPEWPMDTEACRGTLGMNDCVLSHSGTIGYNEAGTGLYAGLQEISIKNKYGRSLTSEISAANGGIGSKDRGIMPDDPAGDFGNVSLMDQDGEYTWPITLLTYLFVRADLSFKDDEEQALLIAFIKALYDPSYVSICETKYGFSLPAGVSLELAHKGIQLLESRLSPDVPRWTTETKAEAIVGAGDYVLSSNRKNYPALERGSNLEQVQELKAIVAELELKIAAMSAELNGDLNKGSDDDELVFTEKSEAMIMACMVLSTLSFGLVVALMVAQFVVLRPPVSAQEEK